MDPNAPTVKPAWLTTEFWLAVIPTLLFLYKAFTGKDTSGVDVQGLALIAVALISAGYGVSRALTKKAVAQAQAIVTNQKLAIAHDEQQQVLARRHDESMATTNSRAIAEVKALEQRLAAIEAKPTPRKTTATRSGRR